MTTHRPCLSCGSHLPLVETLSREDPLGAAHHGCSFSPSHAWAVARRSAHRARAAPQRTPENLYRAACITCHGPDGTGAPRSIVGFDAPLPDFTDCAFATAEADVDWFSVVHEGGPVRGLDRHMPAFGDALSPDEIALAVSHVRTFCPDSSWPRGDLNLPRTFFTEKAFPENEVVWVTAVTTRDDRAVGNDLVYERRIGARNQVELVAPLTFQQDAAGQWNRGLGDIALAFKRVVHSSLPGGRIAVGRYGSRAADRQGSGGAGERIYGVRAVRHVWSAAAPQLLRPGARRG